MGPQCSLMILWVSNTRTATEVTGCTTTVATFTLEAAATTTNRHALGLILTLASESSKSFEAQESV